MRTNLILFLIGLIITVICSLLFVSTSAGSDDSIPTEPIVKGTFPLPLTTNGIFTTQKPCNMSLASQIPEPKVLADIVEPEADMSSTKLNVPTVGLPNNATTTGDCLQYLDIIDDYDWPVEEVLQICKDESKGDPMAIGDRHLRNVSCGLMQINMLKGRPSCAEMQDPVKNIAFAYKLYLERGFCPWSTWHGRLVYCQG